MEEPTNVPAFRKGGADGSRKLRLAKKAESEAFLARIIVGSGYLLIFIFVLAAISTGLEIQHKTNLTDHGTQSKSSVVSVKIDPQPKGKASTRRFSVTTTASYVSNDKVERNIEYSKSYRADKISEISPDYQIGDSIEVFYNPKDPSDYLAPEWEEGSDWVMISLALSFVLLLGLFNIHIGKNYKLYRTVAP